MSHIQDIGAESIVQVNALRAKAQGQQIDVGGKIPRVHLSRVQEDGSIHFFYTDEELVDRKAIIITVPGAFTPTCSNVHISGYLDNMQTIKEMGADFICICPNNRFVAKGWDENLRQKHSAAHGWVSFFPDWGSELLFKMGLGIDLSVGPDPDKPVQLGFVARRSAMIVENGIIRAIQVEQNPGVCEVSGFKQVIALAKKLF